MLLFSQLPQEERTEITDTLSERFTELLEHNVKDFKVVSTIPMGEETAYDYESASEFLDIENLSELSKDCSIEALVNLLYYLSESKNLTVALNFVPGNFIVLE